jgi:hypothetical protein
MANKKVSIDLDIEELLGLSEPKKTTLEYDLNFILENGIEKFNQMQEEHENKKKEFMQLFRECFQEIVHEFQVDPIQQIAVNCSGCRYANRTELGYGKAITKRTKNNGCK